MKDRIVEDWLTPFEISIWAYGGDREVRSRAMRRCPGGPRESGSLSPSWLCLCPRAPRGSAPDRPPLCCSDVLALPIFKQEEPQLSPENEARLPPLQYVLCAATSPAVKLHEETLTYLNQGSGRSAGAAAGPPYLVTVGLAGTQTVLSTSLPCALPEPPHLHLESGLPTPAVGSGGWRSCFWCRPPTGRRLGA